MPKTFGTILPDGKPGRNPISFDEDGIDNDGDNLIDGNDSDEFGPPRDGAIRIAIEKISREILNQITSTW